MTNLLRSLLRKNYLTTIKATMVEKHHNNTSLARETGFSKTHIGNVMEGQGSDNAIGAVCRVLGISIRDLFTEESSAKDQNLVAT